ncbi:ankyrin repeat domain-containing protein [Arcobacter lanthieri]|uniref:ankyrin repeat domain-containing protein n=1 Tax=Aliarcobacter lanthieri TaxID=1355374 RepID=UPI0019229BB7|nr:ankyrin repeat domain-containing protein [Aliarcobacter lanthieri]MBL3519385.1 ankyrin repeat domain-containing protein [Aliarcobacter lanthieri]
MEVTQEELKRYEELQVLALDFSRTGKTQDLKAMIEAGLSVNLTDHKGNTLLMLASYNGNIDTTQMLVDLGADVDRKNDKGQTPLAGVCFKGYLEIVKILVTAGANIHENNGLGTTPLIFASIFGNTKIVKYLNEQDKHRSFKSKLYLLFSKIISLFRKNS